MDDNLTAVLRYFRTNGRLIVFGLPTRTNFRQYKAAAGHPSLAKAITGYDQPLLSRDRIANANDSVGIGTNTTNRVAGCKW